MRESNPDVGFESSIRVGGKWQLEDWTCAGTPFTAMVVRGGANSNPDVIWSLHA